MNDNFKVNVLPDPVLDHDSFNQLSGDFVEMSFWQKNKWFVILFVIGLFACVIVFYQLFIKKEVARSKPAEVSLSIAPSAEVRAGESGLYQVLIENKDKEVLTGVELEISLPKGGRVLDTNIKTKEFSKNIFPLPDIGVSQVVRLDFNIQIDGAVGSEAEVAAVLHYKFKSSNLSFSDSASVKNKLTTSGFELAIVGPKQVSENQLVVFNINYTNKSSVDFKKSRIRLMSPKGFNIERADDDSKQLPDGSRIFSFSDIKRGASGELVFQGNFQKSEVLDPEFMVFFEVDNGGSFEVVGEYKHAVSLGDQPLTSGVEIEGGDSFDPGQTVSATLDYQNNSGKLVKGVEVEVFVDGASIDLASITAASAVVKNNKIFFASPGIAKLASLKSGEKGSINFSFKIKNPPVKNDTKDLIVNMGTKIKSQEYPLGFDLGVKKYKINSKLLLNVKVDHVIGPQPLKVGEKTKYKVSLGIRSGSNDIKDVVIEGFIPLAKGSFVDSSVSLEEKTKFAFDATTGKFTWQAGFVPAYAGSFRSMREMSFELEVVPNQTQFGQAITLLQDIIYRGIDTFTDKKFNGREQSIRTTNASGEGRDGGVVR